MRLNDLIRTEILNAALNAAFGEAFTALSEEEKDLAEAIYRAFASEERERELPGAPVSTNMYLRVHDTAGNSRMRHMALRQPHKYATVQVTDDELYRRLIEHCEKSERLAAARRVLNTKLRELLSACRTDKELLKVWPEGRPFFPAVPARPKGPVVPESLVADINDILIEAGVELECKA